MRKGLVPCTVTEFQAIPQGNSISIGFINDSDFYLGQYLKKPKISAYSTILQR